ncbi:carbohydrate ABC transporter permease [Kineosporia babensis]|uniref:Sugar ABC transporter permease n=1 Tax=Kineosporia babensis TaxID=499548 RepID=A0A9X1NE75_9ACTN|nr:sugar ABC transporter permease [Kineosporia babensis]MCD5312121.1 sugar ABC transporter permease [Kineosporia babensis]
MTTTTERPAPAVPATSRPRRRWRPESRTMFLLIAPSVALLLLIHGFPLLDAFRQSLHDGTLINTGSFVGIQNYTDNLTSEVFWKAASFTLVFTVVGVFGSWAVGLGLALLLRTRIPARGVFKVLLLLPWVVPIVVSSTAINWLVATSSSPIPQLFETLGLGQPLFLADPFWARILVCVFKVWISFPFMMMMSSAALASVDNSVYEAARVDGATGWQQLRWVTLPIVARSTYISWILMTIFCVNDFPTIFLLTGGGPIDATNSLVVLAYRLVFQNQQVGEGVSVAFIMTSVLVVISTLLYRQIRKAAH